MISFSPGLRVGKYEIKDKLGHGGYGIVYAARDTELGRDLAIKFLRPDYIERKQVVQRFLQEARSAAKIVHPRIVTVYECAHVENTGTPADGTIYIAMELLTGDSLSRRIDDRGRFEIDHAIELAIQVSAALEAAHGSGIIHRDLKPDNIYLVPDASVPGGERVKILDFGIAKLADTEVTGEATGVHTHSLMMLGTPRYMSPEQCRSSARVDHRSDLYSLGAILFEMLCGQSPYDGDAGELIAKHQLAPVPRPRSLRPEVPAYLDVLVTTMLAKNPADRPQSAERVRDALTATVRGTGWEPPPDATTPDSTVSRGTGVIETGELRRRRGWWLAGLAAIPASIAFGWWLAHSVRDAAPPPAQVVHEPAPIVADAAPTPDRGALEQECRQLAADHRWDDLLRCADQLARTGAYGDPAVRELTTLAIIEDRNNAVLARVEDAVAARDLNEAYRWLDRIDDESAYKETASEQVDKLAQSMPPAAAPKPNCNADKLTGRAQQAVASGQYTTALSLLEASLRCRPDSSLYRLAVLAACNSSNPVKAKKYFSQLPASQQPALLQLCLRNKVALP